MKEKIFGRKTELIEAALNEFIAKSYEDASLNNIIKQAGISKGTFYYHFHDKQALYLFLLESSVKNKLEFTNSRVKENFEGFRGEDIFGKFKLQARIGAEFAAAYPKYHMLSKMFTKEKGNRIYRIAKDVLGSGTGKVLVEMIDEAVNNGDFRNEFPRDFILKVVNHLFIHFDEIFDTEKDLELDRMLTNLDKFVDFLKNGLAK